MNLLSLGNEKRKAPLRLGSYIEKMKEKYGMKGGSVSVSVSCNSVASTCTNSKPKRHSTGDLEGVFSCEDEESSVRTSRANSKPKRRSTGVLKGYVSSEDEKGSVRTSRSQRKAQSGKFKEKKPRTMRRSGTCPGNLQDMRKQALKAEYSQPLEQRGSNAPSTRKGARRQSSNSERRSRRKKKPGSFTKQKDNKCRPTLKKRKTLPCDERSSGGGGQTLKISNTAPKDQGPKPDSDAGIKEISALLSALTFQLGEQYKNDGIGKGLPTSPRSVATEIDKVLMLPQAALFTVRKRSEDILIDSFGSSLGECAAGSGEPLQKTASSETCLQKIRSSCREGRKAPSRSPSENKTRRIRSIDAELLLLSPLLVKKGDKEGRGQSRSAHQAESLLSPVLQDEGDKEARDQSKSAHQAESRLSSVLQRSATTEYFYQDRY